MTLNTATATTTSIALTPSMTTSRIVMATVVQGIGPKKSSVVTATASTAVAAAVVAAVAVAAAVVGTLAIAGVTTGGESAVNTMSATT